MITMADRDGWIWFDGEMIPWRDANIHVLTNSLHYGMGVFEGIRSYQSEARQGHVFRLADHSRRLLESAKILNMQVPYTSDQISEAILTALRKNALTDAYIRPLCFYGSEEIGLRAENLTVHVMIAAWNWGKYISEAEQVEGMPVATSSYTRHHVNIAMCRAKCCGHYVNSMLALDEAFRHGCKEALLLDNEGYVAEGSGENIFIVRDGILHTPDLTSCLDGITRKTIMQLAEDLGYTIKERRITRDEVYVADEAFFTGTAAEVAAITTLDGRSIGDGTAGRITRQLQKNYFDIVAGKDDTHHKWLTPIY